MFGRNPNSENLLPDIHIAVGTTDKNTSSFKLHKGSYHNIDVRQKAKVLSFGGDGVFLYFI